MIQFGQLWSIETELDQSLLTSDQVARFSRAPALPIIRKQTLRSPALKNVDPPLRDMARPLPLLIFTMKSTVLITSKLTSNFLKKILLICCQEYHARPKSKVKSISVPQQVGRFNPSSHP